MDIKSEVEIKEKLLKSSEDYINDDQSFEEEIRKENFFLKIYVKEEFEITKEFFDFNEKYTENGEHLKGICGSDESQTSSMSDAGHKDIDEGHEDNDVGHEDNDVGHEYNDMSLEDKNYNLNEKNSLRRGPQTLRRPNKRIKKRI